MVLEHTQHPGIFLAAQLFADNQLAAQENPQPYPREFF